MARGELAFSRATAWRFGQRLSDVIGGTCNDAADQGYGTYGHGNRYDDRTRNDRPDDSKGDGSGTQSRGSIQNPAMDLVVRTRARSGRIVCHHFLTR
jgi:hypothetical protein